MSPQRRQTLTHKTVRGPACFLDGQPIQAPGDDGEPLPEAEEESLGPYAHPAPLFIRNTFLENEHSRPPSIEGLYQFDYPVGPAGKEVAGLSRSTSAGDRDERSADDDDDSAEKSPRSPRYVAHHVTSRVYDGPLYVRNTFVDYPVGRPPSLEGFFQEREVRSCPTSGLGLGSGVGNGCDTAAAPLAAWPSPCHWSSPQTREGAAVHEPAVVWLPGAEPWLGTHALPTVGSSGHRFGQCKPCAFVHTKGCESGVSCSFCHLCPPGEKQRRRKDKASGRRREFLNGHPPAGAHTFGLAV